MVFIARDRRKYQFITGYGMEGSLPDVALSTIGERYLAPKFKQGDYGGGLVDAMNAIKNVLQNPEVIKELKVEAEQNSFWYKNSDQLLSAGAVILVFMAIFYWLSSFKKHIPPSAKNKDAKAIAGGCALVFVIVFVGFFVIAFLEIDIERLVTISALPWIALFLGSIFILFKYIGQRNNIVNAYKDEENIVNALGQFEKDIG
ncbi:TPM domain-containing protein [Niabella hibiscisoli]|nr:TPM domain-containing protein [Niabella hibiscisoli]MCH5715846.1 TPM domain-containing protein [Niabella hibiscisoli]